MRARVFWKETKIAPAHSNMDITVVLVVVAFVVMKLNYFGNFGRGHAFGHIVGRQFTSILPFRYQLKRTAFPYSVDVFKSVCRNA